MRIKDLVLMASLALGGCVYESQRQESKPPIENSYKNLYYPHGPKVQPRNLKALGLKSSGPRYDMQLGCYIDDEGNSINR